MKNGLVRISVDLPEKVYLKLAKKAVDKRTKTKLLAEELLIETLIKKDLETKNLK